jgi:tetratricopeptide (TPR) repeat protein
VFLFEFFVLVAMGAAQDAARVAVEAGERARAHGWIDLHARAARYRAFALEKAGARQEADAAFADAHALATTVGHALDEAICLEHRGTLARQAGDLDASRGMLTHALSAYRALGEPRHVADALKELGGTLVRSGDPAGASVLLREARGLYQSLGSAGGAAEALNNLAELARADGRLEEAEACYREAFEAMEMVGHVASVIPMVNLAQVQLARCDWTAAEQSAARALDMCRQSGRRGAEIYALAFGAPCHAIAGRWDAWDDAIRGVRNRTSETGLHDAEVADALELAARHADAAGEPARAASAREVAALHR